MEQNRQLLQSDVVALREIEGELDEALFRRCNGRLLGGGRGEWSLGGCLSAKAASRNSACEWQLLAAFWHHGKRVLSARCGSSAIDDQFLICSDFGMWRATR